MLRGLYTATAGMIAEQRRHDTVTQNIANLNTPGYKQVNSITRTFPEMLVALQSNGQKPSSSNIGRLATGVFAEESMPSYAQGDIRDTGRNTDLSLKTNIAVNDPATGQAIPFDASGKYVNENGDVMYRPEAFFSVMDNNNNVKYTRDGSFQISANGDLLTSQGYRLLNQAGDPIRIPQGLSVENVSVNAIGMMNDVSNPTTPVELGQLGIKIVNRPQELVSEGGNTYRVEDVEVAGIRDLQQDDAVEMKQGSLEGSTVDPTQSMVDLMAAQKAYESNQKVIQFYDRSLEKAVNEIGRV
jgi:flagellar basal-body rod protein FlgG